MPWSSLFAGLQNKKENEKYKIIIKFVYFFFTLNSHNEGVEWANSCWKEEKDDDDDNIVISSDIQFIVSGWLAEC